MFWIKKHMSEGGLLLAGCDKELLGKEYEDGDLQLKVPASFYGEEEVNAAELADLAERANIMNFVGPEIIASGVDAGFVNKEAVQVICGIEHVQCLRLPEE